MLDEGWGIDYDPNTFAEDIWDTPTYDMGEHILADKVCIVEATDRVSGRPGIIFDCSYTYDVKTCSEITIKTGAVYKVCCNGGAPVQKAGAGGTNINNMYECISPCTGGCTAVMVSP